MADNIPGNMTKLPIGVQTHRFETNGFFSRSSQELGITICIENLYNSAGNHLMEGSCCDAQRAAQRIDAMNAKYGAEVLGFCFDTGHANLIGIDTEDFIVTLGDRLKVLHIHDNDGGVLSFEMAPVLRAFPEVMKQDVLRFLANIGE